MSINLENDASDLYGRHCLDFTRHAHRRMDRRNFSELEVAYVLRHGQMFRRTGICFHFLAERDVPLTDRRLAWVQRLVGLTVLTCSEQAEVITLYKNPKALRDIKKKNKFRSKGNLTEIGKVEKFGKIEKIVRKRNQMKNEIATVRTGLDYEEIAPLVEFYLLVKTGPVTLDALYQYIKSIPGVTTQSLAEFLTAHPVATTRFVSDGQGRWSLAGQAGVRAA